MIRFLFKQRQPKRFNIKPRYYDETKEYIETRRAMLNDKSDGSGISQGQLSRQWRSAQRQKANTRSNKTLIVVLAILLLIAYVIFYR